jgi:hypothetical protein
MGTNYILDSPRMCMLDCLPWSSIAQSGAREQDVILLGRDQLANLHILLCSAITHKPHSHYATEIVMFRKITEKIQSIYDLCV